MTGQYFVYRIYDADKRLIYVGFTKNLEARIQTHTAHTWWGDQIAAIDAEPYDTSSSARAAETAVILTENPRWNTRGKWAANASWTRDDFDDYLKAREFASPTSYDEMHCAKVRKIMQARFSEVAA